LVVKLREPIDRARLATAHSLQRLKQQIADLRSLQFPGDHPGPIQWLDLVSGLLDTAEGYLSISAAPSISIKDQFDLVRDAAHLTTEAYNYLVLMRGAGSDELSYSTIPPLQRWFLQLKVPNSTFFRAELVANYELLPIPEAWFRRVRNPSPSLLRSIKAVSWPFLRVTVPAKAFAIVPHLSIVAHEIGHALFSKITWDISAFNRDDVPQLLSRISARLGVPSINASTMQILQKIFQNWLEEFSADAFAFYLTGPAFFFALPEFCQFLAAGYGMSESHPANDLRRAVLYSKLCDEGHAAVFKKHSLYDLTEDFNSPLILRTPSPDQIYNELLTASQPREKSAVISELHASIPSIVPIVYQHVYHYLQANASAAVYSAQKYDDDLQEHLNPMLAAVPPIESGPDLENKTPTEFASILNVGWVVLLTKLSELRVKPTGPERFGSNRLERLQGLLAKAVELSEARRIWQSH
jgi:hypothetical protein